MRLTAGQLNRATLDRQLLLRREPMAVVDAVHRVVGLQTQVAASPYLALWNRLAAFDPAELDAAFADRVVVKATVMRITLHAVRVPRAAGVPGRSRSHGLPPLCTLVDQVAVRRDPRTSRLAVAMTARAR
jgi:DNA glycosylase AlkZ-like